MGLTVITVTGRYENADGTPAAGQVEFQLAEPLLDSTGHVIVPRTTFPAPLDDTGAFSVALFATDDTTSSPTGDTYRVTERIVGSGTPNTYSVQIPHSAPGATVDLSTIAPALGSAVFTYTLLTTFNAHVADPNAHSGYIVEGYYADLLANRPPFGVAGRRFRATDTGEWFFDTGIAWDELVFIRGTGSGYAGVGTAVPGYKLEVHGNGGTQSAVMATSEQSNRGAFIGARSSGYSGNQTDGWCWVSDSAGGTSDANGNWFLQENGPGGNIVVPYSFAPIQVLTGGHLVGIGDFSGGHFVQGQLHVRGGDNCDVYYEAGGSTTGNMQVHVNAKNMAATYYSVSNVGTLAWIKSDAGSGGALLFATNSLNRLRIEPNGNVNFGPTAIATGVGTVGIPNATTAPTTNPAGGGVLYALGGAGKWRGSSGTVTTFGPADPHCPDCGSDFVLEWQNDDGRHLQVCMWCRSDDSPRGVMRRVEAQEAA